METILEEVPMHFSKPPCLFQNCCLHGYSLFPTQDSHIQELELWSDEQNPQLAHVFLPVDDDQHNEAGLVSPSKLREGLAGQ